MVLPVVDLRTSVIYLLSYVLVIIILKFSMQWYRSFGESRILLDKTLFLELSSRAWFEFYAIRLFGII